MSDQTPRPNLADDLAALAPKPKVGTPAPGREYGRLVPPYSQTHCQAEECGRELDEEIGAYLFTDLDSNKLVIFCGATATYIDLHRRDRFALVML